MSGQRRALIVANDSYDHPGLQRLGSPAADAQALAGVLADVQVGDFAVQVVHNESAHRIAEHLEDLLADANADDVLLLHFSCHGLKSEAGELFFAATNTRLDRLASTAVSAQFVQRCMSHSRSRSVVLFLDCCYGGAFGTGVTVRSAGSANVLDSFPHSGLGGGRGRAVITASNSMEYAFEGERLADDHHDQPSVFTTAVVEGLASGEADRDEDGWVSLNELYEYVYDRVRERNPRQTPSRDIEMQGELYLARSRRRRITPSPLPPDVRTALSDPNMFTRLGAVTELRTRLMGHDLSAAAAANEALTELARTDISYVADAATEALRDAAMTLAEPALRFGQLHQGAPVSPQAIRVHGPPIARAYTLQPSAPWIRIDDTGDHASVSVDTARTGPLSGEIVVTGPTGEAVVPVHAHVVPAPVAEPPPPPPRAHTGEDTTQPAVARPTTTRRTALVGAGTLASAALFVIALFLHYDVGYLVVERPGIGMQFGWLAVVVAIAGTLTLTSPTSQQIGPALLLGVAAAATWGPILVLIEWAMHPWHDPGAGFWLILVAHAVLLAAATRAGQQLRRAGAVRLTRKAPAGLVPRGAIARTVTALGATIALGIVGHAVGIAIYFGNDRAWYAAPYLWVAALALVVPLYSAVVTPRLFGACFLLGWLAATTVVYLFTILEAPLLDAAGYAFGISALAFLALLLVGASSAATSSRSGET